MIDLNKLNEYSRKKFESELTLVNKITKAVDAYFKKIYLAKVCKLDEFLSSPEPYDDLIKLFEETDGQSKTSRRRLAVIKKLKEENCK